MKNNKGFSLVELLIVIVIAGLFFGLVISNMFKAKQEYEFKAYLREVRSIIELAREKSISSEVPKECNYDTFNGYGIETDLSTNSQSLDLVQYCNNLSTIFRTFNLSKYKKINLIKNNINFYFKKVSGEINTSSEPELWAKHTLLDNNKCAYIKINNFGIISLYEKQSCN